jgi:Na+/H+ antiporter NhaD/arsenite permease-like protein
VGSAASAGGRPNALSAAAICAPVQEAALPLLILTLALISLQRFRAFQLNRPIATLFGALLMVVFGVISWHGALAAVGSGLEILALLLGMLMMVATLDVAGFFEYLAERLAARAHSPRHFFVQVCVVSAVLSALVLNDAVVLLLSPVIIRTCKAMGTKPVPFLMAETICANIGSVATLVGNPQNAYIGVQSGMPFLTFAAAMGPIAALCLVICVPMMLRFFRKDLHAPVASNPEAAKAPPAKLDPVLIRIAGTILGACVVLFFLSSFLGLSIAEVAMGGGIAMLFSTVAYRGFRVETILAKVDWTILLLFVGLFVVLRAVQDAHVLDGLVTAVGTDAGPGSLSALALVSAFVSNLVSNVPAVLLLSPTAAAMGSNKAWLVLASSSTLAGNATIVGAAANLITAGVARAHGHEFSWARFTMIGLPVAAVTLVVSTLVIALAPL